ncbi:hypothetical protein NHF48_002805 [Sphingomonas sp. H160509]|uniref:hypothetical protein n=1 Tax=Sphingomonas sp. H160509 TaxID=2955313 RepID=UPI00209845DA|nr:hypothetical protein [Sphingomonas sp. H160509]MDD1450135.1 hypothetical protein [Sphingomonas sp. H160509]
MPSDTGDHQVVRSSTGAKFSTGVSSSPALTSTLCSPVASSPMKLAVGGSQRLV